MQDLLSIFPDMAHFHASHNARITILSAAHRVKTGSVQLHRIAVFGLFASRYGSGKLLQMAVLII